MEKFHHILEHCCGCIVCKAVTTPSMAVSHIMLEAYKKHVLVSLIVYGKVCLMVLSSFVVS